MIINSVSKNSTRKDTGDFLTKKFQNGNEGGFLKKGKYEELIVYFESHLLSLHGCKRLRAYSWIRFALSLLS